MILRVSLAGGAAFAALATAAGAQPPASANVAVIDNAYAPASSTVALGGTVRFAYDDGEESHNVHFEQAGPACTQVTGSAPGAAGRVLPKPSEAPGWSVDCRFAAPGIYTFYCDDHVEMTGKVTVANADGSLPVVATPTPTATPRATATPAPSGGGGGGAGGGGGTTAGPGPGATAAKLTIAAAQRGSAVTASVTGGSAKTTVRVEALARRTDLRVKGKAKLVRVGRVSRTVAAGATVKVKVAVNAKAKAALKRRGKLKLTVRATLDDTTTTRTVTLRAAARARVAQKATTVSVADNTFSPKTVTIARGGTVTWRWTGKKAHNVVGPGFASRLQKSGTYRRKLTKKGTISYRCTLHRGMEGKIRVK
ncbi:MAG TPA: plastocyanin/azurin family copper-binding protein [Solirubrobacter sp.]|nr:plastocyanin/azurin family copper-binding protein [Solirubrobacter sp.]